MFRNPFLMTLFVLGAVAGPAKAASSLVVPRPPSVISPDLSDPWLLQIRPGRKAPTLSLPATPASLTQPSIIRGPTKTGTSRDIDPKYLPQVVDYGGGEPTGTVVIDTEARFLYLVLGDGKAERYGVGVGRPGFEWAGEHRITRKAEWPDWVPPDEMRARVPNLPVSMKGGPDNPLGARALYLGSTLYRIHGSNEPWTIGHAVSSGCIRMRNEDVMDLYDKVKVGTRVIVL
jgi:lipoprotein-anchoring transpeptidase ErfK/SrfK